MKQYWQQLQPREQRTILIGGIITAILLIYVLIFQPLFAYLQNQKHILSEQNSLLSWIQPHIQEIIAQRQQVGNHTLATPETLLAIVDTQLKASTLSKNINTLAQNAPQHVNLHANSVPFDEFIDWLSILTKTYGIRVQHLNVTPKGPAGLVEADLELSV